MNTENKSAREQICECLHVLSKRRKQIVVMRALQNKTYVQIAKKFKVSTATIRQTFHVALRKMRKFMSLMKTDLSTVEWEGLVHAAEAYTKTQELKRAPDAFKYHNRRL